MKINNLRVMALERVTAINAYSFALGITTLHEFVHYVRYTKSLDNYNLNMTMPLKKNFVIFWPSDENLFKTNMYGFAQGTLSLMQGANFTHGFAGGAAGSWGASLFGAFAGSFANSTAGTVLSGMVLDLG